MPEHAPRSRPLAGLALLSATLLASCGTGSAGLTATPNPTPTPEPPALGPISMSIKDPRKDVDGTGYADAVSLSAAVSGDHLELHMGLRASTRGVQEGETLLYLFALDTDLDGDDDWWVDYETESGEFIPILFELADPLSQNRVPFPGGGMLVDDVVSMTVELSAIGVTGPLAVRGAIERMLGTEDQPTDYVPDDQVPIRLEP